MRTQSALASFPIKYIPYKFSLKSSHMSNYLINPHLSFSNIAFVIENIQLYFKLTFFSGSKLSVIRFILSLCAV